MAQTKKQYDCIISGSCVVDVLVRPVHLDRPIGGGVLRAAEPLQISGGGITCNSGITMTKLGMSIGIFSYVGDDAWGPIIRDILRKNGIDDSPLLVHPTEATSTTAALIDDDGERSFYHCVGAPKTLNAGAFLDHLDLFAKTRMLLIGYYSLMPNLQNDLPRVFKELRAVGCKTAMDAAGDGGGMKPLDRILPELDIYVPSFAEARHQTGYDDPRKIIDTYRVCGAPGVLGVKLGREGVLLSPSDREFIEVPVAEPPGGVVDTTGAGDSFYAGLLTGLLRGMSFKDAGRLGTAAGACCVTAVGGSAGARDFEFTANLAGIDAAAPDAT